MGAPARRDWDEAPERAGSPGETRKVTSTVGAKKIRGDGPAAEKAKVVSKTTAKKTPAEDADPLLLFVRTYSSF